MNISDNRTNNQSAMRWASSVKSRLHNHRIKSETAENRISFWYNHFKNAQSNHPVVENEENEEHIWYI